MVAKFLLTLNVEPLLSGDGALVQGVAAPAFNFLTLLRLIASLRTKIPKAIELITALYNLFAAEIEAVSPGVGGLELVALTAEEEALAEKISQALSAEGTQAAFDLTRIRKLVKFLSDAANSDVGKFLLAALARLAAGG